MADGVKRDPRAKFIELANARVARAIKDLRLIGNLSDRKNYQYTDEEARKILKALESELEVLKSRFKAKAANQKNLFRL